jgi:hypothetical protein
MKVRYYYLAKVCSRLAYYFKILAIQSEFLYRRFSRDYILSAKIPLDDRLKMVIEFHDKLNRIDGKPPVT